MKYATDSEKFSTKIHLQKFKKLMINANFIYYNFLFFKIIYIYI